METKKTVCQNPWCKAPFFFTEKEIVNGRPPKTCKKCKSFETETTGGVEWVDHEYPREVEPKNATYKFKR
jgi:hypothetical protein